VCAKSFIDHFGGFWLRILCISHGLFDADDLIALRAFAEAMTGAIHFVLVQANPRRCQLNRRETRGSQANRRSGSATGEKLDS
jgi:hypothetical protein